MLNTLLPFSQFWKLKEIEVKNVKATSKFALATDSRDFLSYRKRVSSLCLTEWFLTYGAHYCQWDFHNVTPERTAVFLSCQVGSGMRNTCFHIWQEGSAVRMWRGGGSHSSLPSLGSSSAFSGFSFAECLSSPCLDHTPLTKEEWNCLFTQRNCQMFPSGFKVGQALVSWSAFNALVLYTFARSSNSAVESYSFKIFRREEKLKPQTKNSISLCFCYSQGYGVGDIHHQLFNAVICVSLGA